MPLPVWSRTQWPCPPHPQPPQTGCRSQPLYRKRSRGKAISKWPVRQPHRSGYTHRATLGNNSSSNVILNNIHLSFIIRDTAITTKDNRYTTHHHFTNISIFHSLAIQISAKYVNTPYIHVLWLLIIFCAWCKPTCIHNINIVPTLTTYTVNDNELLPISPTKQESFHFNCQWFCVEFLFASHSNWNCTLATMTTQIISWTVSVSRKCTQTHTIMILVQHQ